MNPEADGTGATPPPPTPADGALRRLTVLISGRGSNLKALIDACDEGRVPARVTAVISNRPEAPGLEFARVAGIPSTVVDHRGFRDRERFDAALAVAVEASAPDLVILAGFMRILTEGFTRRFHGRMLNIHPSLLPAFRGLNTHARAIDAGEKQHGASVHFVTPELDAGPVLMQARVPVCPGDTPETLEARVHRVEHRLYPAAVALICSGRVRAEGDQLFDGGIPMTTPLLLDDLPEAARHCADSQ